MRFTTQKSQSLEAGDAVSIACLISIFLIVSRLLSSCEIHANDAEILNKSETAKI